MMVIMKRRRPHRIDRVLDQLEEHLPAATMGAELLTMLAIDLGILDRNEVLEQLDRMARLAPPENRS
jgi:hypothetical protein